MSSAFADTSFYLALLRVDDARRTRAVAESGRHRRIVTTEFVLVELGNSCSRATDHADFAAMVASMRASPRFVIVPLSTALFDRGLTLMNDRRDKDSSLTDCTSFVVMHEQGIMEALTADRHFEQAGFTALLR